jgi:hypothetical protein
MRVNKNSSGMAKESKSQKKYFFVRLNIELGQYRTDGFIIVEETLYHLFLKRVDEKIEDKTFYLVPTGVSREDLTKSHIQSFKDCTKSFLEESIWPVSEIPFDEIEVLRKHLPIVELTTKDGFGKESHYYGYGDCSAFEAIMLP